MYKIVNRRGKGSEKSVTVTVKKQNSLEKAFNFTLANFSTFEAKEMIDSSIRLFEDKMNVSDILTMLSSIVDLARETEVKDFCHALMRRVRGDE